MSFMGSIINALSSVSDWFYDIYVTVNGWVWPFWLVADYFYQLHLLFNTLAWKFYDFSNWVNDIQGRIGNFLSWDTIWSYILSYVPNLTQLRDWFYSWWSNVTSVISSWWSATQNTVQGWITVAVQPFNNMLTGWKNFWNNLWPQLVAGYNSLKSSWDNFRLTTFPNLVNFTWLTTWWDSKLLDVQSLIDSAIKSYFPFYDDLVRLWGDIVEFITNPVEYIWKRFTDWFFGTRG